MKLIQLNLAVFSHRYNSTIGRANELTVKELKERRLSASGALDSTESKVVPGTTNGSLVHQQILQP